ncbi:MAG: polysaccharide biosynthesis tyrosine autokinase [Saprospiraceae bacterium]|nr:polysaccharide biosynthesis tyrosine autokinase [Saprospiraceae bacterium]
MHPNTERRSAAAPLKYWFTLFLRNWYWFLVSLGGAIFGAIMYQRYTNPVFEIGGAILINSDQKVSTSEQAILSELGYSTLTDVTDQVQYLKSSYLMRRVVDSLDLHISYTQYGRVKVNEQYKPFVFELLEPDLGPALFGRTLRVHTLDPRHFELVGPDGERLSAQFGDTLRHQDIRFVLHPGREPNTDSEYDVTIHSPKQTARRFASSVDVRQVERSNVIAISLVDAVPDRAVALLNTLVEEYNASVLEEKKLAGNNTLVFIDDRLGYIAQELYDVESDVEQYRRDNALPMDMGIQAETYLDKVADVDRQLLEADVQQELLDNLSTYLNSPDQPFPDASALASESLGAIIRQYNELLYKRRHLAEAATERNPAVGSYDEQLGNLRDNIRTSVVNLQRELAGRRRTLEERLRPLERQINAVPRNERELLQIMRQQKIKETLFLFLLQKREETALNIAAQTSDAFLLDEPENRGPVSPGATRVLLFAIVLGMALPAAALFLRDQLDDRLRTRRDVEAHTQIPFLGQVALARTDSPVVVQPESRTAVAEMFRLLRTNLQFNAAGTADQVLLVTSSVSGEGKSFTALNLAVSQSLLGKKTVLVGLDLRKPKVVQYLLGRRGEPGVTHYLLGKAEAEALLQPVPGYDNLYCIDSGPVPPNPSELLQQESIRTLFAWLREHFEYVVVDTAPVGLVTDALLLAPYTDHTLLVARYGMTTQDSLQLLDELYRSGKLVRPGIILNGVRSFGGYGYGRGYGYGYGYGGGYFEGEGKQKKRRIRIKR